MRKLSPDIYNPIKIGYKTAESPCVIDLIVCMGIQITGKDIWGN